MNQVCVYTGIVDILHFRRHLVDTKERDKVKKYPNQFNNDNDDIMIMKNIFFGESNTYYIIYNIITTIPTTTIYLKKVFTYSYIKHRYIKIFSSIIFILH